MTNAVLEKRVAKLESEVRSLRAFVPKLAKRYALPTGKRLLAAVREGERDVKAGRVFRGNLRDLVKLVK
jgi:predicted transcriptional regulator